MAVAVLTPTVTAQPIDLGRSMFRKQVLKKGQLRYGERTLQFGRLYFDQIVTAFKARAFDAVPVQLADGSGAHNNSPLLTRGDVVGLEADDEGLYATVSLTDEGAALVREHPNLGVSVRVIEDYDRGDGQSFPAAMQHVLACWDPRVTGMAGWQAIDAATPGIAVLDLSALTFPTPDSDSAADQTSAMSGGQETTKGAGPVAQLTEEELAQVRAMTPLLHKLLEGDEENSDTSPLDSEITDTELDEIAEPAADEVSDEETDFETEQIAIAASNDAASAEALELAHARIDSQTVELARLRHERDAERYEKERDELARAHGIPPRITDLCRRWLTGSQTVELANGQHADPGADIRKVLHELGRTFKALDLGGPIGSAHEVAAAEAEATERDAFIEAARCAGFGK